MISVTAIGSCRIHNPLRALHAENLIRLNRSGFREFTHAPRETLQKLRIADGRLLLSTHMVELILGPECGEIQKGSPRKTDLALVEISSLRRLTFQGLELQFNFVIEWAKKYGLEDWLTALSKKARQATAGNSVSVKAVHEIDVIAEIATGIKMSMETDDAIRTFMRKIVDDVRIPVIFAGHFNPPDEEGNTVADRKRLNDCLKVTAFELGSGYIDPNELILRVSSKIALRDSNHWNYDFEKDAGQFYWSKIRSFMSKG